jgi:hypothetical protein
MPTYYVSQSTGLNTNNGTSPVTPWQTLAFALGAASGTNPGIVGGDIVYVAPGSYNEAVTIGFTSPSSTVQILGDPLNTQGFPGVQGGIIQWWNTNAPLTTTSKNNLTFSNIYFERIRTNAGYAILCTTCYSWTINKCVVLGGISTTVAQSTALNFILSRCVVDSYNASDGLLVTSASGANYNINLNINDCLFLNTLSGASVDLRISGNGNGGTISNCTFIHSNNCIQIQSSNTSNKLMIQNSLFFTSAFFINPAGSIDCQYNRYTTVLGFQGVSGTGSTVGGQVGLDFGNARLLGYGLNDFFGSNAGAANIGFGTATNAPVSDLYGVTWLATPDAGAVQRSALSNFQPPTAPYVAAERNASAITIAPASTSQSIELYLGATGLTFATSGLAAYYVRNQSAPVAITLVTQTPTGAWSSGGFAEISSSLVPGVYRLDVPNAAFAAGASDVTIVVRGASGTNGAVLTVTLSSGGLTAAQTAAAVWDEARASHTTVGTFGQYVNAELVTPVTSAALVRMGPFEVRADGLGASDPLDLQTGAQHGIDIQCVGNNGAGIDITSATVTAKVYNSGATLVDTYSCTATYAADGRATFTIDTTVTNTPGTYTATITRSTSANDTQIFGPLRIYVRDI